MPRKQQIPSVGVSIQSIEFGMGWEEGGRTGAESIIAELQSIFAGCTLEKTSFLDGTHGRGSAYWDGGIVQCFMRMEA